MMNLSAELKKINENLPALLAGLYQTQRHKVSGQAVGAKDGEKVKLNIRRRKTDIVKLKMYY